MEDVLDIYHRPRDLLRPVVCLDETSRQVLAHTRDPLPVAPADQRATTRSTSARGWSTSSS